MSNQQSQTNSQYDSAIQPAVLLGCVVLPLAVELGAWLEEAVLDGVTVTAEC